MNRKPVWELPLSLNDNIFVLRIYNEEHRKHRESSQPIVVKIFPLPHHFSWQRPKKPVSSRHLRALITLFLRHLPVIQLQVIELKQVHFHLSRVDDAYPVGRSQTARNRGVDDRNANKSERLLAGRSNQKRSGEYRGALDGTTRRSEKFLTRKQKIGGNLQFWEIRTNLLNRKLNFFVRDNVAPLRTILSPCFNLRCITFISRSR